MVIFWLAKLLFAGFPDILLIVTPPARLALSSSPLKSALCPSIDNMIDLTYYYLSFTFSSTSVICSRASSLSRYTWPMYSLRYVGSSLRSSCKVNFWLCRLIRSLNSCKSRASLFIFWSQASLQHFSASSLACFSFLRTSMRSTKLAWKFREGLDGPRCLSLM